MDGNMGGFPGAGGLPGGFAGATGPTVSSISSGSNVNSSSVTSVAMGSSLPAEQTAGLVEDAEPAAKRMKVEPPADPMVNSAAVTNMAAIAASRAAGAPTGDSGMSTEQFLQSLPTEYSMKTPAYMVMLQQQQQQQILQRQQLQQQFNQQQAQRQQNQQQQQQQLQQHIELQRQLQFQRQLQAAGVPFAMMQHQQQFAPQGVTPANVLMHNQAQQIMMAALAQNSLAQLQPQQRQPVKTEPSAAISSVLAGPSTKKPQPTEDPACMVCRKKGDDLFTCSNGCGLSAHPRCIGEKLIDGTVCASCSLMVLDRNTKENLHGGGAIVVQVRRAILCINAETTAPSNFDKFGHLASLRLHEIAQIAGYPIAPFAARNIETHLNRWMSEKLVHIASWPMNVRDVFTMMIGLYSLDRAGISHQWGDKAIELVRAKKLSPTDFLGWHPAIEGPNVRCSSLCALCCIRNPPEMAQCSRCRRPLVFPTIFTKFISALLASHYAEHVGISFGASFLDVFSYTHTVRGHYKGLKPVDPNGYDWNMFADQLRMIFGLIDIVSDFGVLELDPDLFEAEASIIFNQNYLNHAMVALEFETVGKFLQCMKLFGKQRADQYRTVINNCEQFLLQRQHVNGSWSKVGSTVIDQFKATVVCAKALVNPVIQGRGAANGDFHRLLVKWAKKTPGNLHAKRSDQLGQGKLLAAGVTVTGRTVPNLKRLEVFYRRQIVPTSGLNSLETLATARLRAIWSAQKLEPQDDEAKDDLAAGATDNEDGDALSVKAENENGENAASEEDESLIKLSLSGELSLFDGLKFEDGDVIDISGNGEPGDDEKNEEVKGDDGEVDGEDQKPPSPDDDQEEAEDAGEDVYDDDNDADIDGPSQLPEPDAQNDQSEENEAHEIDINEVDISGLDGDLQLDDSYAQSMDLALDM